MTDGDAGDAESADADAEDGGSSSRFLDENGRLFGLINVVDALAILLVIAIVVAGVALLFPSGGDADQRFATLDFGEQPDFVAEEITPGDTWEPEGTGDELTITDVYRFNTEEGTGVIARAEVNGTVFEPDDPDETPVFEFIDEPLRLGQSFEVLTDEYEAEGEVTRVDRAGDTLPISDSEFVIESEVSSETADELAVGDEFVAGGEAFGEITALELFPDGADQYALIGFSVRTIERGGDRFIGDTRISIGTTLSVAGDGYDLSGEIIRRGTSNIDTEPREFVLQTNVPATITDDIRAGDEFEIGETAIVSVDDVSFFPTNDPDVRQAYLGVSALTRLDGDTLVFGDRPVRIGSSLPIETDRYDLSGEVVRRGTTDIAAEPREFVIQTDVSATVADDIRAGDEFTIADDAVVTVDDVTVYATGNADVRRVVMGVSALTREDGGAVTFGDDRVRIGDSLPVETEEYDISGEVVRRGSLDEPGTPATQSVTVRLENIPPERADILRGGMTEETRDLTTAQVQAISTESADIVLESEDGDIFLRQHPRNKDVELSVDLSVRELDDGTLRFRGETLRGGQTVTLELDQFTITGEITELN